MADMQIYGAGLGIERKGWFAEFGYYIPRSDLRGPYKEALWLEINRVLQPSYELLIIVLMILDTKSQGISGFPWG